MTAGSRTRRATGVRSLRVTLASALTKGVCSHTPVNKPTVFGSPLFSARYAAATAELPPGLLTTTTRTGSSFSRSAIRASARASTSLPPPGPVCTTSSTGRVGLNPWARAFVAGPSTTASASSTQRTIMAFLLELTVLRFERPQAPRVELAEQRDQQDQQRQR